MATTNETVTVTVTRNASRLMVDCKSGVWTLMVDVSLGIMPMMGQGKTYNLTLDFARGQYVYMGKDFHPICSHAITACPGMVLDHIKMDVDAMSAAGKLPLV